MTQKARRVLVEDLKSSTGPPRITRRQPIEKLNPTASEDPSKLHVPINTADMLAATDATSADSSERVAADTVLLMDNAQTGLPPAVSTSLSVFILLCLMLIAAAAGGHKPLLRLLPLLAVVYASVVIAVVLGPHPGALSIPMAFVTLVSLLMWTRTRERLRGVMQLRELRERRLERGRPRNPNDFCVALVTSAVEIAEISPALDDDGVGHLPALEDEIGTLASEWTRVLARLIDPYIAISQHAESSEPFTNCEPSPHRLLLPSAAVARAILQALYDGLSECESARFSILKRHRDRFGSVLLSSCDEAIRLAGLLCGRCWVSHIRNERLLGSANVSNSAATSPPSNMASLLAHLTTAVDSALRKVTLRLESAVMQLEKCGDVDLISCVALRKECSELRLDYDDCCVEIAVSRSFTSRIIQAGLLTPPPLRDRCTDQGGATLDRVWVEFSSTAQRLLHPHVASSSGSATVTPLMRALVILAQREEQVLLTRSLEAALKEAVAAAQALENALAAPATLLEAPVQLLLEGQTGGARLGADASRGAAAYDSAVSASTLTRVVSLDELVDAARGCFSGLNAAVKAVYRGSGQGRDGDSLAGPAAGASLVPPRLLHDAADTLSQLHAVLQAYERQSAPPTSLRSGTGMLDGAPRALTLLDRPHTIANLPAAAAAAEPIVTVPHSASAALETPVDHEFPATLDSSHDDWTSHGPLVPQMRGHVQDLAVAMRSDAAALGPDGALVSAVWHITEGFERTMQRARDDAKQQALAYTATYRESAAAVVGELNGIQQGLAQQRLDEEKHRVQRAAERAEAADKRALQERGASELLWLYRAALLCGLAVASTLAWAGWDTAMPVALAWARTYAALLSPSLVCAGGSAGGSSWAGPSVWALLSNAGSPLTSAPATSLLSRSSWIVDIQASLLNAVGHSAVSLLPCGMLAVLSSGALWLGTCLLLWFSPTALGAAFLLACVHGAWAQLARLGWVLGCVGLPALAALHGVVFSIWYVFFPRAAPAATRLTSGKQLGGSESLASPRIAVAVAWPLVSGMLGVLAAALALKSTR